jgi:hypothetical protein
MLLAWYSRRSPPRWEAFLRADLRKRALPHGTPVLEAGDGESSGFRWEEPCRCRGRVFHRAGIAVVAYLFFYEGMKEDPRLVREVLDSLDVCRDPVTWSVYGTTFSLPATCRREKVAFKPGYHRMEFGRRGDSVVVERFGMAEAQLEGRSLAEWYRGSRPGRHARLVRRYAVRETEQELDSSHRLLRIDGEPSLLWWSFWRGRLRCEERVLHCARTNRIILLGFDGRADRGDAFRGMAEGFRCCSAVNAA